MSSRNLRPFHFTKRRWLAIALSALVLDASSTSSAWADAKELKERGDASFDGRNYADALEQYRAALAQGGDPRIHYNIAQALTALERYPEALASYQAFLAEAPSQTLNAAQQEKFFQLLDELKTKITRVWIRCDVPGARVLLRNVEIGQTPIDGAIPVNAGPARLEVIAEGFLPVATEIRLLGGQTQTVNVALQRIDFGGRLSIDCNVPAATVYVDEVSRGICPVALRVERGSHLVEVKASGYLAENRTLVIEPGGKTHAVFSLRRAPDYTLAYVGFGVGFVGVTAGTVTGILAFTTLSGAKSDCDTVARQCGPAGQPGLENSRTYGTVSTIAFGVGAAGVGLGIYGWLRARPGAALRKSVEMSLLPAGFLVRGSFE
jgi:hypothetical protein